MTTIKDIEKFIEQKLKQANLSFSEQNKIVAPLVALSEAKKKLEESKKIANKTGIDTISLEFYLSELYSKSKTFQEDLKLIILTLLAIIMPSIASKITLHFIISRKLPDWYDFAQKTIYCKELIITFSTCKIIFHSVLHQDT